MSNEAIEILITKKLNGEISDEEIIALNRWLAERDENQKEYDSYVHLWHTLNPPKEEIDLDEKYEQFLAYKSKKEYNSQRYIKAAAVMLVLFASYLLYSLGNTYTTELNRRDISLDDGSLVKLNRYSKLTYDFTESERILTLNGEGFFKVKKDGRPFIIETQHGIVKVLGTQFVVNTDNYKTTVSVLEGKVLFQSANDSNKIILTKGMVSSSENYQLQSTLYQKSTSWLDNRIEFTDLSLTDIVKELEDEFKVSITIENETLKSKKITASLIDTNLDDILNSISELIGATIKYENDRYIIL